jgi:threonyl-tRNA synthetase
MPNQKPQPDDLAVLGLSEEDIGAVESAFTAEEKGKASAELRSALAEFRVIYEELKKLPMPERYYLKAMNCPHHHKIFAAAPRSYRDLPLRLAEYGTCYRYEQSGELFGLMRVRSMQMNDAHIYCTLEQFEEEFLAVCNMYLNYFKIFGIEKYQMRFSTHAKEGLGKKYVNEPELWLKTEDMVRRALQHGNIPTVEAANEAAFYGPKIDVQVWSAIGKEFTLATNQVDFAVPRRFGLTYTTPQNTQETPLCIHRAPLGTHERFIGFLIEHYAGNFPVWLSPEQVRLLPISDAQLAYCKALETRLKKVRIRTSLADASSPIGAKIRQARLDRVPYMLIVGDKEIATQTVAVRSRQKGDEGAVSFEAFLARVQGEIQVRK